jgi:hypothetical protein
MEPLHVTDERRVVYSQLQNVVMRADKQAAIAILVPSVAMLRDHVNQAKNQLHLPTGMVPVPDVPSLAKP